MFLRVLAFAAIFLALLPAQAQEAFTDGLAPHEFAPTKATSAHTAWVDLRQTAPATTAPQNAPAWVESVNLVPVPAHDDVAARTTFRIRVAHPRADLQMMMVRLFFDDKPDQRPTIVAWDESGSQVLRSHVLGAGIDLPTSDTVILPMIGVSCIDVEVTGDGTTVRGLFLDWMVSSISARPLSADPRDVIPEPFAAAAPLHAPEEDSETFGTVTAALAPEVIRIGAGIPQGAAFQFGLETRPLMALITFEISSARIDAPPEIYVNGDNLGPASLTLSEFADPAYRGETERLVSPMHFRYTGWLRAQKLVPAVNLKVGTNDVIVAGAPGSPVAAIRATQIQLKYLWDKSDYLLNPK